MLRPDDEQARLKYERTHALLCSGYSREQTIKLLEENLDLKRAQCYNIVRESMELFGDITKSNKEGKRYIIGENFMVAAQLAKAKGDLDNYLRALEDYAKINGLYDYNSSGFDPEKVQMPQQIIFMSDPKILIQNQLQPANE